MNNFGDVTKIPRRKLIQLAPAALALGSLPVVSAETCTNSHASAPAKTKSYKAQFFTPDEMRLLDAVMDKIIPSDEHSPGAHDAQVPLFADLMIATSPNDVKEDWRRGLRLLSKEVESSSLDEWLAKAAVNERNPATVSDLFFVRLKQMTVEGYYTSSIGIHKDLEYQGNEYLTEFKGCSHEDHQG